MLYMAGMCGLLVLSLAWLLGHTLTTTLASDSGAQVHRPEIRVGSMGHIKAWLSIGL